MTHDGVPPQLHEDYDEPVLHTRFLNTRIFSRIKCDIQPRVGGGRTHRETRPGKLGSASAAPDGRKILTRSAIGALCVVVVTALCAPTFAVGPCPLGGPVDCDNCEFKSDDMTVAVGDTNQTLVVRGIHDVCILGFAVSLEADSAKIELTDVGVGSSIGDVDFENGGISPDSSKVLYGVVFDITNNGFATKNLPPGDDEIVEVTFNVVAVTETTTSVEFSDVLIPELSGRTARNLMTNVQGFTIQPDLNAGTITIIDPVPTVDSVSPSTGLAGDTVKIVGNNFDQGDLQVTICGNPATVQFADANTVQVTVPTCDAEECVDVVVATAAGSVLETDGFCYLPSCVPDEPEIETTCDDGIDNDCDEAIDGTDSDCEPECLPSEGNESSCDDGIDNDCDEAVDGADSDCELGCLQSEANETTCDDGVDNDCDGDVDDSDSDCLPSCVPDEPEIETTCDDGIDNDCDEAVDGTDSDCELGCLESEANETTCDDGVDNDCDGDIDDSDSDCPGASVGPFIRGDCDGNGTFGGSPTEAIVGLQFSFRGGDEPPCLAACDAEANGSLGITDYLRILRAAFLGHGEPDAPFPDCSTSGLGTDILLGCQTPLECH